MTYSFVAVRKNGLNLPMKVSIIKLETKKFTVLAYVHEIRIVNDKNTQSHVR